MSLLFYMSSVLPFIGVAVFKMIDSNKKDAFVHGEIYGQNMDKKFNRKRYDIREIILGINGFNPKSFYLDTFGPDTMKPAADAFDNK